MMFGLDPASVQQNSITQPYANVKEWVVMGVWVSLKDLPGITTDSFNNEKWKHNSWESRQKCFLHVYRITIVHILIVTLWIYRISLFHRSSNNLLQKVSKYHPQNYFLRSWSSSLTASTYFSLQRLKKRYIFNFMMPNSRFDNPTDF